jgi:hypothetical protein
MCRPCAANQSCSTTDDCWNTVPGELTLDRLDCIANVCRGCNDGVQNLAEVGVDCGRECAARCRSGPCEVNDDCINSECISPSMRCADCTDGILNQGESDVDCGGFYCDACSLGRECLYHHDCDATALRCNSSLLCEEWNNGLCMGCGDFNDCRPW